MCLKNTYANTNIYSTEMANQWKIAVMTCLVLFMAMQDAKPAFATNVWQKTRMLEERDQALRHTCLDKCIG